MQFFSLITGAALLDSVNPCAFSILFLTIAFLWSLGRTRKHILIAGGLYIFGIASVYVLIGLGVLQVLSFFNIPNGLARIGATILIVFGIIELLGALFKNFPIKLAIPKSAHQTIAKVMEKASFPSALFMGVLVGMFEFPCTGGPYLFVLGLLHDQGKFWQGFVALIWYNFIFVLPLILALLLSVNKAVAEKIDTLRRRETKKSRIILALIMIGLGAFVLFW